LENLTPQSIYDTVGWAAYAWYNRRNDIRKMQLRGMASEFGWDTSAREYADVYQRALDRFSKKG
ncbi:MAG TPA: glycogen synthase, partial [Treponemataceae bacterium]|nr:glycogen synthase [Treponemataceae bacterium]